MQALAKRSNGKTCVDHLADLAGTLENGAGFIPMQGTLLQEHSLLRTLIDNMPDFIYVKDVQSRFVVANLAVAHMMGAATPEALLGKTDFDFYPYELAAQYYADEQEIIRSGQPLLNHEEPIIDPSGKRGWILTNKVPLRDSLGNVVGLVGIGRDISERMRAEAQARSRTRELTLLNQIIAASVSAQEPESLLETACRELCQAFAAARASAMLFNAEKTAAVVVAEHSSANSEQSLADGRLPALGQAVPVAGNPYLNCLLTHKAPLVWDDSPAGSRLAPLYDLMPEGNTAFSLLLPLIVNGEVVGSLDLRVAEPRQFSAGEVSLAWNVADQVAVALGQIWLRQEGQRLSAAIQQTADSVIISDAQGTILYVNPAFEHITGYSRSEAVGQNPRILKSGKHDAAFYEELWRTISSGRVWHGRFVNKKKDGTLYTEDATISPVRDNNGAIVNYVAVKRDVTRELRLEEQYYQAQKMEAVGQLTAGIAHDFNNLLTAINGFAQLLQFELPPDDPRQELVGKIGDAGRRAAELVSRLLAFSRKQAIEPQVLDLNQVVADTDKMLRRIIGEDIELETLLVADMCPVRVDPVQIEQVIVNLAVNARDAMPRGGKLTIETANLILVEDYAISHLGTQPGEYVLLAVSDTGVGMSQAVKTHLFEPFFTTKERGKGSGLGLATVYGIVKQSGGDIWVYSEEGVGTTFKIYLPRAGELLSPLRDAEVDRLMPSGGETLLLIEDDDQVRDLARRVLHRQGYTLLEAVDGEQALQLAAAYHGPIHLLLTDVVMPGMSGKAVAEQLIQTHPDLQVLFMSGYTEEAIARHRVLEPGFAFLEKPFTALDLARKVRQVLNARRSQCQRNRRETREKDTHR